MEQKTSKPIKIVLAEDEPTIAMAYQRGLGFHGYEIILARDGAKTLATVAEERPDILLLDLIMPVMDGVEVLEILRREPASKKLPVIVLTNLGQASDAERVIELGAKAYLIKANLSLKELVRHINDALGLPQDANYRTTGQA